VTEAGSLARSRDRIRGRLRRLTAFLRQPDFLILGAQKSGTTSLYRWLSGHPEVTLGPRKEQHYFDKKDRPALDVYRARFPARLQKSEPRRRGEATPEYLFLPWAPPEIVQAFPDLRYLVVLRDPVQRAHAHYRMHVARGDEPLGFLEALEAEPERLASAGWPDDVHDQGDVKRIMWFSYATRGEYATQLERWWDLVPRERFLVLRFEDLVAEPRRFAVQIQEFLGLPTVLTGDEWPHDNQGPTDALDGEAAAWLAARFREPNRRLHDLTGIDWPA